MFAVVEPGHSWTWWIWAVIGAWAVLLVIFVLVWPFIANWVFGPRTDEDDEQQIEALRRWELQKYFRKQRKKKKD